MRNIKSEKGSLALFVTIAMLFFMAFLLALFLSTANEQKTQLAVTARIKETYEQDLDNVNEIYNSFVGTEEYIPIYTAEQLKKVGTSESVYVAEVGKYYTFNLNSKYILKNNIELNPNKYTVADDGTITFTSDAEQWTPIGTSEKDSFTGIFDGNGYKISGLYIDNTSWDYQGLFGYNNGTIEKLTLSGNIKGKNTVGGIVAFNYGNGNIKNCINECNITGSQVSGGIVGLNRGIVTSCENLKSGLVSITGSYGAGGIAGRNEKTIENCKNNAYISGTAQIGGIVGNCDAATEVLVKDCRNLGKVYGSSNVGGIVGGAWLNSKVTEPTVKIEMCYNDGSIECIGVTCGGIAGTDYGAITRCYNIGVVTGKQNVGGIVGAKAKGVLKESYNNGTIQHTSNGSWTLGGIAGWSTNGSSILLCYNAGEIYGKYQSGGIIGGTSGNVTISNCYNSKDFSIGTKFLGGIVGRCDTSGGILTIENCYSMALIQNTVVNQGAILGYDMNGNAKISNCYYLTGTATGGINGADVEGQTKVKTSLFMQSSNFVDLLGNTNWKLVNNKNSNYPVLSWEDGTAITNYTYAQDGLILWYDAIDNLGTGTHSETSTTWKDLSLTGNDGTLVSFKNDSTSGWITENLINGLKLSGNGEAVLINKIDIGEITMEVVVKHDEHKNSAKELYIISNVEAGGYGIAWYPENLTNRTYVYSSGYKGVTLNSSIGKKYYIASRAKSGKVILNSNDDVSETSLPGDIGMTKNDTYLVLGGNPSGTNINGVYEGTIYSVRVYNRVLTDEEIQKNYQIDKTRFGI